VCILVAKQPAQDWVCGWCQPSSLSQHAFAHKCCATIRLSLRGVEWPLTAIHWKQAASIPVTVVLHGQCTRLGPVEAKHKHCRSHSIHTQMAQLASAGTASGPLAGRPSPRPGQYPHNTQRDDSAWQVLKTDGPDPSQPTRTSCTAHALALQVLANAKERHGLTRSPSQGPRTPAASCERTMKRGA
jgi:hypothetical protein